jgi:hypothetical protein
MSVLLAGRALEEAVRLGDAVEIAYATAELVQVAQARESTGAVEGFVRTAQEETRDQPADEELTQILTELNVGQVLLAAGEAVGESDLQSTDATLESALDELEDTTNLLDAADGSSSVVGFTRRQVPGEPPLEMFRGRLTTTVDGVVKHTVSIGIDVGQGLASIPAIVVNPILTGVVNTLTNFPQVGRLITTALRAIRRALGALQQLVPESLGADVRQRFAQWWNERDQSVLEPVARWLLGVVEVDTTVRAILSAPGIPEDRLREGTDRLTALVARYERSASVISGILRVLSTLLGWLGVFASVAAWVYGAAAMGYFLAFGAAVWIGRDCLDTGSVWDRVPGVRTILTELSL